MKKLILSFLILFSLRVSAVDVFPMPVGSILTFSGTVCPKGFLDAQGSMLNKTDYPRLWALYGTQYGSATATQFRTPNYRGYFLRGWDGSGSSVDVDNASRSAQYSGGFSGANVGTLQQDGFRSHTHIQDAHSHSYTAVMNGPDRTQGTVNPGNVGTGTTGQTVATNQNTGGNETRPKNISVLYCIKF